MPLSSAAVEGVAGAVGGMVALVTTYPLMTVSTLQATRSKEAAAAPPTSASSATTAATPMAGTTVPAPRRAGTVSDLAQVISTHGWTGLYSGLRPALLGTALSQGVYFYFYQRLRDVAVGRAAAAVAAAAAATALRRSRAGLPPLPPSPAPSSARPELGAGASLLIAALAGCGNVLLTCPIWVVATRMQADRGGCARAVAEAEQEEAAAAPGARPPPTALSSFKGPTPVSVAREVWTEGGLPAFWRGVAPSLVMVSNPTVTYFLYEALLARAVRRGSASAVAAAWAGGGGKAAAAAARARYRPGPGTIFAVTALSKLGATAVTYPLLLVKARLQAAGSHTASDRVYTGTADAVARIWAEGGVKGFYAGLRLKIVQSILGAALMMALKEEISAGVRAALAPTPRALVMGARPMTSPARAAVA